MAFRDCNSCRKWQYVEEGFEDERHKAGDILTAMGHRVRRNGPTPCEYATCPKGHYNDQRAIVPLNLRALVHYEQCVATGNFPDDAIVARNARILKEVFETVHLVQQSRLGVKPGA